MEVNSFKIFAIIVTYNGVNWIAKCLSSIRDSAVSVHTLVIDNASSDDTVKIIRVKFPEVELIQSEKNLGFGQANNLGLRKALAKKADYVFLLNQDAWIESETIEKLINVAENHPEYGILSPYHLNYEGTATEPYFEEWVVGHYTPGLKEDRESGNMKEIYESKFVHAACWLMPIDTVKRVGGFDPLFFHYGEDNDYVQRLLHKGLKVGITVGSKVCHDAKNPTLLFQTVDKRGKRNEIILSIKDLKASLPGVLLLFFKGFAIQTLTNGHFLSVYRDIFVNLISITRSRFAQKGSFAYLEV